MDSVMIGSYQLIRMINAARNRRALVRFLKACLRITMRSLEGAENSGSALRAAVIALLGALIHSITEQSHCFQQQREATGQEGRCAWASRRGASRRRRIVLAR